uniref:Phorbol-ester/DAG-type domain-containing protein n=1 Tax=Periophthalmus magnuspinnatus TaxID=409849 RepID=A0A3B4B162_9GOBI
MWWNRSFSPGCASHKSPSTVSAVSCLRRPSSVWTSSVGHASQLSVDLFSGMHNWFACSHARPTYCNVCREALSGVTSHGLSCEGTTPPCNISGLVVCVQAASVPKVRHVQDPGVWGRRERRLGPVRDRRPHATQAGGRASEAV